MKPQITAERLLELGGSLEGIIKELSAAVGAPAPNPRQRRDLKAARVARVLNQLDARAAKKRAKLTQ